MTFNGLDLLFVLIGIGLLFGIMEIYIWFRRWRRWDYDRRRSRKLYRYHAQDQMNENAYRQQLRLLIRPGLVQTMHAMNRSFQKLNEVLAGTKTV